MPTHQILNLLLYLSLFLLSYIPFSNADIPPCNAQDAAVLLRIRDHFGGPNGYFDDWSNDTDCCAAWSFVGCSTKPGSTYGRVFAVTTSTNLGLSGTIPSDFGDLPYLDFLSLPQNVNLTGPIPKSLSKLKRLYHLDFTMNSLSGPIPGELLGLKALKEVDLSGNKLSGVIPSSVSLSSSLSQFNVSHNELTGNIPKMPKSLKSLDVSYNQLCGKIPSGLNPFPSKSFQHNKCLCGSPLPPCK